MPNVGGFVTFSPRLDRVGNSVRGVRFFTRLVDRFTFHTHDNLNGLFSATSSKQDLRQDRVMVRHYDSVVLCSAAATGDLVSIRRHLARGADLNVADYDGRTPLHLAASEGRLAVVKFLIRQGVHLTPVDRWGGTPVDDARREGHLAVVNLLLHHSLRLPNKPKRPTSARTRRRRSIGYCWGCSKVEESKGPDNAPVLMRIVKEGAKDLVVQVSTEQLRRIHSFGTTLVCYCQSKQR